MILLDEWLKIPRGSWCHWSSLKRHYEAISVYWRLMSSHNPKRGLTMLWLPSNSANSNQSHARRRFGIGSLSQRWTELLNDSYVVEATWDWWRENEWNQEMWREKRHVLKEHSPVIFPKFSWLSWAFLGISSEITRQKQAIYGLWVANFCTREYSIKSESIKNTMTFQNQLVINVLIPNLQLVFPRCSW
jgi:hypothetical protein